MLELRDATAAREWLYAGACTMRLGRPTAELLAQATPWLVGVLGEYGALPPPGSVIDLGLSLLAGTVLSSHGLNLGDAELRAIVRAWETEVLGRLQGESRLLACAEAIERLPVARRPEAVSITLASLLARLGFEGVAIQPGVVRRLESTAAEEVLETGLTALSGSSSTVETLVDGYTKLVRASRHVGQLITDADVFVLEHLEALRTRAQRLEVAQIADVAARLSRSLPKRMRRQSRSGHVAATVEDDSSYPTGGFSSIETSGSLENLVTSELVYMEDETARLAGIVDLFEVRYVEGELLYYSRDESVLVREQRTFYFVLHPELVRARFKDRELDWQRLVIVLGLLLCLVQRLSEWLSETGLRFHVVFIQDAQSHATPLQAERLLCELLLSEWIEKGVAVVVERASWRELIEEAGSAHRRGLVDVLSISLGELHRASEAEVRVTSLDVSEAMPATSGAEMPEEPAWSTWLRVASMIAHRLI